MEKKRPITYYWGAGALDSLADSPGSKRRDGYAKRDLERDLLWIKRDLLLLADTPLAAKKKTGMPVVIGLFCSI